MIKSIFILLVLLVSLQALSCEPNVCAIKPMSSTNTGDFASNSMQIEKELDEKFNDDELIAKIQSVMLSNLKGSSSYKYFDQNDPAYKGDDFLEYATMIFAAEAGENAQKDYEKSHRNEMIPVDKWESEVLKAAKDLEKGSVNETKDKCAEYDCATPDCSERKEDVKKIVERIKQIEAALDNKLVHDLKNLDTDIFRAKNRNRNDPAIKSMQEQRDLILKELGALIGKEKASIGISRSDLTGAISNLKELLINDDPSGGQMYGLELGTSKEPYGSLIRKTKNFGAGEDKIKNMSSRYPIYYNQNLLELENSKRNYYQADFRVEEVKKKKFYTGNKEEQFNIEMIELDLKDQKYHEDNFFSLNESDFSKKMDIPEDKNLNAIHCESSASDLRPTENHLGKTIPQGNYDYLNFELSQNRLNECEQVAMKKYNLTADKIIKVKSDDLSENQILELQAKFFKNPENKGKVQIFESFKGEHGDGTSGYKSFYCANDEYVENNLQLCPREAINLGFVEKEDLKAHWKEKYKYSDKEFEDIVSKKDYPPYLKNFIASKKRENPSYKFKISDLSPEELTLLENIYAKSRYVKVKVYHSPEVVPPEENVIYTQRVCSDTLTVRFSEDFKVPPSKKSFLYQSQRVRGDGLYGSKSDWGSVSCPAF